MGEGQGRYCRACGHVKGRFLKQILPDERCEKCGAQKIVPIYFLGEVASLYSDLKDEAKYLINMGPHGLVVGAVELGIGPVAKASSWASRLAKRGAQNWLGVPVEGTIERGTIFNCPKCNKEGYGIFPRDKNINIYCNMCESFYQVRINKDLVVKPFNIQARNDYGHLTGPK